MQITSTHVIERHRTSDVGPSITGIYVAARTSDHQSEFCLVVDLSSRSRWNDVVCGAGERVGELREKHRARGRACADLLGVVDVVQAEADNLLGVGDGRAKAREGDWRLVLGGGSQPCQCLCIEGYDISVGEGSIRQFDVRSTGCPSRVDYLPIVLLNSGTLSVGSAVGDQLHEKSSRMSPSGPKCASRREPARTSTDRVAEPDRTTSPASRYPPIPSISTSLLANHATAFAG